MTIRLDHTIVPAKDKMVSAEFFAEIFGLSVRPGHVAQVQVDEFLTLDFADEPEAWGGPGFDPRLGRSHHYAFQSATWSSRASSAGCWPRALRMAASRTTTPMAGCTHATADAASISRIPTVTCSR